MAKDKADKTDSKNKKSSTNAKSLESTPDLTLLSKVELNKLAKDLKIKNYSKMNKDEIILEINKIKAGNSDISQEKKRKSPKEKVKVENEVLKIEKDNTILPENKLNQLESLQRNELVERAKNLKIKNYSRLNKSDLIKAILKSPETNLTEEKLLVKQKDEKVIPELIEKIEVNLDEMQMPELIELAKEKKVKNYSRMSKARLIKAINQVKEKEQNIVTKENPDTDKVIDEKDEINSSDKIENDQAIDIELIGRNEGLSYTDKREAKAVEEETISLEQKLRNKLLLTPSKFGFGKTNEAFLLKDEENIVLPDLYMDEDKIVLLPVDPSKVFTYWDLSKKTISMIQDLRLEELTIKVNDVTGIIYNGNNPNVYWFETCLPYAKDWYIYPNQSNRNLCVELGYIINNNFYIIARSNTIYVPPRSASNVVADTFVITNYNDLENRTINPDKEIASDRYIRRPVLKKEKPYFGLNDYNIAENFNLKKMPQKMPIFSLKEEIPEYFVEEFEMTGPQIDNTVQDINFVLPEKLGGIAPAPNYDFRIENNLPEFEEQKIYQPVQVDNLIPVPQAVLPQPEIKNENLDFENNIGEEKIITREYFIPNQTVQPITRLVNEVPETLVSFFEHIPGFDKTKIKVDSYYYELPGENQKAIRVFYEWYEGETPYIREYFWISDVFPQVHENIYKVSWGSTWVKEFIGGSEHIRFIGASERFLGSSDIFLGGTERFIESGSRFSGGSEMFIGNSDRFMGGSEEYIGGSDRYLGGSDRYIGASEKFIGSSNIFSGASEHFLGASNINISLKDRYKL